MFIDADKPGYPQYMEWAIEHVRPGGVITAHNTLWGGSVAKPEIKGEAVDLVRDFNRQAASDPRIACTIFPAGDGTLVAVVLP